jgi:hypothetical protein
MTIDHDGRTAPVTTTWKPIEVHHEGVVDGTVEQVWDAFTRRSAGWLWPISYEPRVGGAERGLTPDGGTVTEWRPARRFATRAEKPDGWWNQVELTLAPQPGPGRARTRTHYRHTTVLAADTYDVELAACEAHTAFYQHSLGEYVAHFAGRDAAYVSAEAPASSARPDALRAVRRALGLGDDVGAGEPVHLAPDGLDPIDGVVDHATDSFLGIRTGDALVRVYGRGTWGWPLEVVHHHFGAGVDVETNRTAWQGWLRAHEQGDA